MEYFAFGETFVEEHKGSNNSPYKFNGKELDEESGYTYYGARYLDMRYSIWNSTDPLSGYNPIFEDEHYIDGQHNGGVFNYFNHNTYGYCYQSPVNLVDPNGKQAAWGAAIGAVVGAATEYIGIVGSKMLLDDMDFYQANSSLGFGDAVDIGVATAFGAAEGTIDNGIGLLGRWITKPRNLKILKLLINVGIDMLETGIKEVLKGTEYEKMDVLGILAGSLTEVGLGGLLKTGKHAKKIKEAEAKIAEATAQKSIRRGTVKSTRKNIRKQDAIISSQHKIIKKSIKADIKRSIINGSVSKGAGNVSQEKTKNR